MEIQLEKCLRYNTVLDYVLEPYWGNIILNGHHDILHLSYMTFPNMTYEIVVGIFGINIAKLRYYYDSDPKTVIQDCIREIEQMFVKYSVSNPEFYHYPGFVLFQVMLVMLATDNYYPVNNYQNCSFAISYDNYYLYVNGKLFQGHKNHILEAIEYVIARKSPDYFYYTMPIKRMKAAFLRTI
jgi:hypothetical protein